MTRPNSIHDLELPARCADGDDGLSASARIAFAHPTSWEAEEQPPRRSSIADGAAAKVEEREE